MIPERNKVAIDEILATGRARARQLGLSYDGALSPSEAHRVWQETPHARLVDVRTRAEWDWVGRIPGAIEVEMLAYPGNKMNAAFLAELEQKVEKKALVMFICRSGGRSHNAAMLAKQMGYAECYNVLEGFEGDKNAAGHRNAVGGWRAAGLPWTQS